MITVLTTQFPILLRCRGFVRLLLRTFTSLDFRSGSVHLGLKCAPKVVAPPGGSHFHRRADAHVGTESYHRGVETSMNPPSELHISQRVVK